VYGTGIASETLLTSATELPVCPDTQASFICLYVFAIVPSQDVLDGFLTGAGKYVVDLL
jgi:hypothetical protein